MPRRSSRSLLEVALVGGIVAAVHFDGSSPGMDAVGSMAAAAPHRGTARTSIWHGAGAVLIHQSAAAGAARQPLERAGLVCLSDARLDQREALRRTLLSRGLEVNVSPSDTELILGAFLCWGVDCTNHLYGDYAFIIWDPRRRRVFAARDPMGMRALYLHHKPRRRLLLSTEIKQLLVAPDVAVEVDELGILATLSGPYLPADRTLYAGIEAVPGGMAITVDASGLRRWRHWHPDPGTRLRISDSEAAEGYRSNLSNAVRDRMASDARIGISLSGGLDSINLASMAGWLLTQRATPKAEVHAYSWRFAELTSADERSISDHVLHAFPLCGHTVDGDLCWPLCDIADTSPDRDDAFRGPYDALVHRTFRQASQDGVRLLMTGARGDELTGDWAYDEAGLLASGQLAAAREDIRALAQASGTQPLRVAADVVRAALQHRLNVRTDRRWTHPSASGEPWPPWIPKSAAQRVGLDCVIREWRALPRFAGRGRSLRLARLLSPQSARLAVHAERTMAQSGLTFADPYTDRRLTEFVLSLPAWQVHRRTAPKQLARSALRGIVPETARLRANKTIPERLYERGLRHRANPSVEMLLSDPVAARHGWLDPEPVRRLHDAFRRTGTITYDYWWVLTTEWWLRRWWS